MRTRSHSKISVGAARKQQDARAKQDVTGVRKQIEALESILDSMGDGVVVVDLAGTYQFTNPAARRLLRLDTEGTDARQEFYLPDAVTTYPSGQLPLVRALRGEPVEATEVHLRHAGVSEGVWLSVTAHPLRDNRGRLRGAVAVFRDIGERKRAERERAALLVRAQAARREADETIREERLTEEQLKLLVDASGMLLSSLSVGGILPNVLELARKMVPADGYAIWRGSGADWRMLCSAGLSELYQKATFRSIALPKALDQPLAFEDVEHAPLLAQRRKLYLGEGIRSLLAVPLRIHGTNTGTITFYSRRRRQFSQREVRAASALANLAAAAIGTAELYELQTRMRSEAEDAERRSRFLAEATHLLASSLDYRATLADVARLAVPHLADWCMVTMAEPGGALRELALAHRDSAKVEWAREWRRRYPPDPNAPRGVSHVLRTGASEIAPVSDDLLVAAARDPEHLRLLRQVGFTFYMCVPVTARGCTLGAITFVSAESGRRYGSVDLQLAEHLGRRAGLAIDNAMLYEEAQRERAAAEAALEASRRSEARFRRLVESGIFGVILGEEDTITEANDVFLQMVGYPREELAAGKLKLSAITAAEDLPAKRAKRQELLRQGACPPYETEFMRQDGTRLPVLLGTVALERAPRLAWVCVVLDLTGQKGLEQRLRESQKLESVGLLAGGVAHDFNNLLTGILGNASLALDDLPAGHPLRPAIENVVRAGERAADLTRQLLAYSGRGRFIIQALNLSELVQEISSLLRMSIPKKVHLRLDLGDNLPQVEADSSQVQQLIMNLVLNAAEAIGEDIGTVLVTTGVQEVDESYIESSALGGEITPGRYVYLEVHDTGCGMDEDTRTRIFDPFFTTKFTGRGLGLAAVLGIVRGHKGDIKVYSEPGRGSTFKVLLPALGARQERPEAPPGPLELHGAGTILVVDDEEVVRGAARAALERYGYTVLEAENGPQAIEWLRQAAGDISLLLLDMTMPLMSGEETLQQLRAIRSDLRVIVSSGYNEMEAIRRFTGSGVAAFIQKPYTAAQLAERVKRVLEHGAGCGTRGAGGGG